MLNSGQNQQFHVPCDLDIWRMTLKTIGHLFYAASNFVHHFIAINEFKLELRSQNAQFGSKSMIFFILCDLQIWQMTLKNNRALLLYYFKLCTLFCSHWWIKTGVTVRKCPVWIKVDDFLSCVSLRFDRWPWKATGHLSSATSSFVHHFICVCDFKLDLQSRNG